MAILDESEIISMARMLGRQRCPNPYQLKSKSASSGNEASGSPPSFDGMSRPVRRQIRPARSAQRSRRRRCALMCRSGTRRSTSTWRYGTSSDMSVPAVARRLVLQRGARILAVADLTRRETLPGPHRLGRSCRRRRRESPVVLVANKAESDRTGAVGVADLEEMANTFGCTYVLTSAKNGQNVGMRPPSGNPYREGALPAIRSPWRSLHKPRRFAAVRPAFRRPSAAGCTR